jgi:hypothetical protein
LRLQFGVTEQRQVDDVIQFIDSEDYGFGFEIQVFGGAQSNGKDNQSRNDSAMHTNRTKQPTQGPVMPIEVGAAEERWAFPVDTRSGSLVQPRSEFR